MNLAILTRLLGGASAVEPLAYYDLESSAGGLEDSYDAGSIRQWQWGETTNGPGAGYDGLRVWSTGLVSDYQNETTNCLVVPIPNLAFAAEPVLTFYQWYRIEAGDSGRILADGGEGWEEVTPLYGYPDTAGWTGSSPVWELVGVDLAGLGDTPQVCLLFEANADGDVDDGWFVDNLGVYDGDAVPPRISGTSVLADTDDLVGPYEVRADVIDNSSLQTVVLRWSAGKNEGVIPMTGEGIYTWTAAIPGQVPDTVVDYWIEAADRENIARDPATGAHSFRVYLPPPLNLDGPDGRVVGPSAELTWSPPETSHPVEGYAVFRNGAEFQRVTAPPVAVALTGGVDEFVVRARYAAGLGDPSNAVTVDGVLPVFGSLDPAAGYQGDHLRLSLSGEYLLLTQDADQDGVCDVQVDLGEGVEVAGVEVRDVDRAWVEVSVLPDATPGARDLVLTSAAGVVEAAGVFAVLDAADLPRLVALDPDHLRQGDAEEVLVSFVGGLAGVPTVDVGEGVVVESVAVEGQSLRLALAVANNAPVGEHPVTVDDGARIFTGVSLEVRDILVDPGANTCASVGARPAAWAVAALLVVGRRPRRAVGSSRLPPR